MYTYIRILMPQEEVRLYNYVHASMYSETCIKRPRLGQKKVGFEQFNRGGLLVEVRMHGKATIGT